MNGSGFSHTVFPAIIENLPLGLMVIDAGGSIVFVNDPLERVLGVRGDRMLGRGWGEVFLRDEGNSAFNQVILDVISREPVHLERSVPYTTPRGGEVFLSITSSFLREGGGIVGIVVLVEDVTEKHRLHERERELLKEKGELRKERGEGLRSLAFSVAHQIRNPATIIGGMSLSLLRRQGEDSEDREILDSIVQGARRLEQIVGAVSAYAGLPPASKAPVSLARVVERGARSVAVAGPYGAGEYGLENTLDGDRAFVDGALLERGVAAVFQNCVDFSRRDRVAIRVSGATDGTGCTLTIDDDGPGVDEERLPYVFDPFYTTKADGVGMGLCLVRRIAVEHLGKVEIGRGSLGGTRVRIVLPRCLEDDACVLDDQ